MAITLTKYVDITSGVGGAPQAAARELIGRLFTDNPLVPTSSIVEMTTLGDVGTYFGTDSQEYKRAVFYFGWVSKLITSPQKISFARWVKADVAPLIYSAVRDYSVDDFSTINDGSFTLTLGSNTEILTGLDFTSASSLADVAGVVQTAVQGANAAALWSSATVVYDSPNSRFVLTGGAVGDAVVAIADGGSGTEVGGLLGFDDPNAILSDGKNTETVSDVLIESSDASNNFGSFIFMPAITLEQAVEAGQWNLAQNVMFQFYYATLQVDAQATVDALGDIGGTGVILKSATTVDSYPEMMPMIILAATDYNRRAANQNYMYQQFNIDSTVTDTTTSNDLDALRVNYYGQTQQAGRNLEFFQRGLLMGLATNPLDMNTYANEQWLKDANSVSLINLLLALPALPANTDGEAAVLGAIQPNIEQAKVNGTILAGKPINATQQAYITSITGDENAWRDVQNIGYYIQSSIVENAGEFKITYLLIYAKGDAVRTIEGTQTQI